MLRETFPGCSVRRWAPVARTPRGKVAEAIERVDQHFESHPEHPLMLSDLRQVMGLHDSSNFRKTVREHPHFRVALEERGLEVKAINGSRHLNAIMPITSVFGPDDDDEEGWEV